MVHETLISIKLVPFYRVLSFIAIKKVYFGSAILSTLRFLHFYFLLDQ